jgi:hypothetical protein
VSQPILPLFFGSAGSAAGLEISWKTEITGGKWAGPADHAGLMDPSVREMAVGGSMRFVVLEHRFEGVHYDFMLESGAVLRTWKLPQAPAAGLTMSCLSLADHRLIYLQYEGPISGGRGEVSRWDEGTYRPISSGDDRLELELTGKKLTGRVELVKEADAAWRFLLKGQEEKE